MKTVPPAFLPSYLIQYHSLCRGTFKSLQDRLAVKFTLLTISVRVPALKAKVLYVVKGHVDVSSVALSACFFLSTRQANRKPEISCHCDRY